MTAAGGATGIVATNIQTFSGGITNSGLFSVSAHNRAAGLVIPGIQTFLGGITNSGTLQVTSAAGGATGIDGAGIATFSGGIVNGGVLSVSAHTHAGGIVIPLMATFLGGITNSGTLQVTSAAAGATGIDGADIATFSGGIASSGLLSVSANGHADGIAIPDILTFQGGITNSGTLQVTSSLAGATGIFAASITTFSGGITNTGLLSVSAVLAAGGIIIASVSTFLGGITNSGTIAVTSASGNAFGIDAEGGATFLGGITNRGLIGVIALGITALGQAKGITAAGMGTFSGGIMNSGTIRASSVAANATGIFANAISTFSGGILNSGLIAAIAEGPAEGIYATPTTFLGGITNGGTILVSSAAAKGTGIYLDLPVTFQGGITNSGTIQVTAAKTARDLATTGVGIFTGGLTNTGLMAAVGVGAGTDFAAAVELINSTFTGGIQNRGTMLASSTKSGIFTLTVESATFLGGITNTGLILATSGANTGNAVFLDGATFSGGLTNSGTIQAVSAGKTALGVWDDGGATFSGGITNTGQITAAGKTGIGIYVQVSSTFVGGITNSGLISGSGTALGKGIGIYLDPPTFIGNVSNTGTIIGTGGSTLSAAIDASRFGNTLVIDNPGGTMLGGVVLSDTVAQTLSIEGGLARGRVFGALGTVTLSGGTVEVPVGAAIGAGPADGGTPIAALTMTGGNLQLDVTPTPQSPTVSPTGTTNNGHITAATINVTGGNFVVGVQPGLYAKTTVYEDVLQATGGTFNTGFAKVFTTSGVFGATLLADATAAGDPVTANTEDLELSFVGFGSGTLFNGAGGVIIETPNQKNTGGGVDGLLTLPGAATLIAALEGESASQIAKSLDALSGVQYAAGLKLLSEPFLGSADEVPALLYARNGGATDGRLARSGVFLASNGEVLTDAGQTAQIPATGPSAEGWSIWGRGYGIFGDAKTETTPNNVPGYSEHRYGGMIGADYTFNPSWLAGAFFDYSHDSVDFKANAGNTALDSYQFGLYGQYRQGPWYVNALASGGLGDFATNRIITTPLPAIAHGSYSGQNYGAYAEGGWDLWLGGPANAKLTPFLGLAYLHTSLDQFTETGAGIEDLVVKGAADSLQSALGVRFSTHYALASGATLTPELRAAWQHEFLDQQQKITSAFAANPGGGFSVEGARFSRESAIAGIGITYGMSPQTKLFADYDFKWNGDYTAHQVSAGIRFSFGAPAPLPPPTTPVAAPPPPQPAPPPAAQAQVFVVYFDFDKAALTPEAVGIIQQAADAFKRTGAVTIKIDGYTDLAGTQKYNEGLSKRRADAVRAELAKDGVANTAVAEAWHGKSDPAVPTPDGVREPRNRRVTLALP